MLISSQVAKQILLYIGSVCMSLVLVCIEYSKDSLCNYNILTDNLFNLFIILACLPLESFFPEWYR